MLTVSCSHLVELDQAISSIIKNPKSYQTVERWTCIGGKRHILQALHRFMTHFISTILVLRPLDFKLDLELQTWIYGKIGLNLVNDQTFSWTIRAKHHGQKIALIGQKMQKLKKIRFFMIFSCSSTSNFSCFLGIQTMLELYIYIHLSPCHRIIFEYEVIVWGWKPVRFTQLSANGLLLCASDIANLQEGCMILWDSFLWDFSILQPLIHAIQYVKLISRPLNQHFLRKVKCLGRFF